jgi:hypothetical protein
MEKGPKPLPGEVKFVYQKDPSFQVLVDKGIGTELTSSGYCWAACLDMALSPFVLDDTQRRQIILDSVKHEKLADGAFNEKGEFNSDKAEDLVDILNNNLLAQGASVRLNLIRGQEFSDYHKELLNGRTVIFGLTNQEGAHVMLMDKVYVDGGKYIYAIYDPGVEDSIKARFYNDNFQLYGQHMYSDTKLSPFIISVGIPQE